MKVLNVVSLVSILPGIVGQLDSSSPGCAISCWENTKYVSKCLGEISCLCSEPDYQDSVFQCLYSQCDTAHFGSALHHVIAQCYGTSNKILFAVPPIPNHDSLRRREAEYAAGAKLYGSSSAAGYPTESAGLPTQSVNYPTQSVGGPYTPSTTASAFSPETATSPAIIPAALTTPSYSALAKTTMAPPVLYTGSSTTVKSPAWPIVSITLLVILLT